MRVPLSWLRELCPTDLSAEELAERITANGVHVEEILRPWAGLSGVVVARVLEKRPHPSSDKLTLGTLDTGTGTAHVAAGVANWEVGDLVPYAPPGARVPALAEPLGVRTLRGERSEGMLCSPHELGISPDHGAILMLPPDLRVGADVQTQFGLDDAVLDIEIEPNRPDLMSVRGVAREVAAATGAPLSAPDLSVVESVEAAAGHASVEVRDAERCPRYLARVLVDVKVGPSPIAVQARLTAAGMRPISNVVDATNYELLELGHPLHPFDLHRLDGRGIVVRRADEGERIVTLDGVERTLTAEDLVIADHAKAVAVAGVMGSAPAEVHADTTQVLLESAHFARRGVLFTARRLKLSTEASMRFERGTDPEMPAAAAARASRLILEWAGGRLLGGAIDVGTAPPRRRVGVRPSRASFALAEPIAAGEVVDAFDRLGISAVAAGPDRVEVEVPGYRVDLDLEEDLIEEVARIRGYASLPSTVPGIPQAGALAPSYAFRRRLREALVRAGLREVTSIPFASLADARLAWDAGGAEPVRLANPLEAERPYLRTALMPGLLRALKVNLDRQVRGAALFEVGHVFRPGVGGIVEGVVEREAVAAALTGPASPGWPGERRPLDFFDAKGVLEGLLASLGIADWSLGSPPGPPFHPARSATVLLGREPSGVLGELHPGAADEAGIGGRVALLELDVAALARHAAAAAPSGEVPRFPAARRDLAFVVDDGVPAAALEAAVRSEGALVDAVTLFDVFAGPPVPEGRKSLAFSVDFRAPDRTLTDEEVGELVERIRLRVAEELGGELRAG